MRLFYHLIQILVMGLILLGMLKLPLYTIPYLQGILVCLIIGLMIFWFGLLYYRTPKNKRKFWILFLLLSFSFSVQAQFCSQAERYDQQTFTAMKNNWQGDEPCSEGEWRTARETLNKLQLSPSRFVPSDKLSLKQLESYRSFRSDSHWGKWVSEKFSALGTTSAEELACAAQLVSLCSAYEERHPGTRRRFTPTGTINVTGSGAKTVGLILSEDAQQYGCWPCRMARIVMETVQEMSSRLEDAMRQSGLDILKIFMLLWILYTTFLAVVFPSKGASFIKDLMVRLLCVLIAAIILSSGNTLQSLYKNFLTPIVNLGLGISQEISNVTNESSFTFSNSVNPAPVSSDDYCSAVANTSNGTGADLYARFFPSLGNYNWGSSDNAFLSRELQLNLLCMTQKVYRQASPMTAVGQSLMSFAKANEKKPCILFLCIPLSIPNPLAMWIVGFTITILFTIFSFLVAFKIIDIFLRLGFVLVLMPLFVASWAFPLTRNFTKQGFMFLMGIVSEFLGLALSLTFIMLIFETGIEGEKADLIAAINAPYSKEYGENLYNVIISNGGWYFFFMLIAVFIMGIQIISVCTKVVNSFFGTSAIGGDMTGGVAVGMVKMSGNLSRKTWNVSSKAAKNANSYHTPSDKSKSFVLGRAVGRMRSGQNPLKDIPNPFRKEADTTVSSAPKRYFGEKAGEGVDKTSQRIARGLDRIGVTAGQALQKTGIGAIVGVPLTLLTKTLTTGVRTVGKISSGFVKAPGAIVHGVKKTPQALKNVGQAIKKAPKAIWNKTTEPIKKGFKDGKK